MEAPITSSKLAKADGISDGRAREHLKALKEKNLIVQTSTIKGRGHPYEYEITDKEKDKAIVKDLPAVSMSACIEDTEAFYRARSADSIFSDAVFHPISGEAVSLRANERTTLEQQSEAESGKNITKDSPSERANETRNSSNLDFFETPPSEDAKKKKDGATRTRTENVSDTS